MSEIMRINDGEEFNLVQKFVKKILTASDLLQYVYRISKSITVSQFQSITI